MLDRIGLTGSIAFIFPDSFSCTNLYNECFDKLFNL